MKNKKIISVFIFIFLFISINAQVLTVEISNIRNKNGYIALGVFVDEASFDIEKPYIEKTYFKHKIVNGKLRVEIKLKPGVYGVSVLDDENSDGEMEYSWIGLPREGYGFSNFYHTGITKPNFKDFDFIVGKKNKIVQVKMKYF